MQNNSNNIFGLDFGTTPVVQPPSQGLGIKAPVVETKKAEPNLFDELFSNDTPAVKPVPVQPVKQEATDFGSLNLYGNSQSNNNAGNDLLGGLSGLNLYGSAPSQPQPQGGNNLLGNNGFNITMQTGQQPQTPVQPQFQPQPQNTGFNFLGTNTPQAPKPDTSFLGFGNLTSSSNSSQTVKGY